GALIAAAICAVKDTQAILDMYRDRGEEIFPTRIRNRRAWPLIGQLWGFLYPHGDPEQGTPGLSTVVKDILGDTTISAIAQPQETADGKMHKRPTLLIMAYDTLSRNTTFFASDGPTKLPKWYSSLPLWQICTASASAPTYFPPYRLPFYPEVSDTQYLPHIDGGVSANNPSLAAVAHALRKAEVKFEDISVLSIGTGQTTEPYTYQQIAKWKPVNWIANLSNIFLNPGAAIDNTICSQILNAKEYRHVRLDFELNHHLVDRKYPSEYKMLRQIDPNPHNQYLDPPKQISEAIDDPTSYGDLTTAAQAYLKKGFVTFFAPQWKKVTVKQAIAQFITDYP
ncbi:MAG: patatin-like phospholipase family protein, partial [Leptolyngbyaceae cyanobacterium]